MDYLLESIRIIDRQAPDLTWHQIRMQRSLKALLGYIPNWVSSDAFLTMPSVLTNEVYKCRIVYLEQIFKIEFLPYQARSIQVLKLIEAPNLNYQYKWQDRKNINQLYENRGEADDILICQNGALRDTSYCNILAFDGDRWYTPQTPLLPGTQRQKLMSAGLVQSKNLLVDDLVNMEKLKLINAMLPFEQAPEILIEDIIC